MIKTIGYIFGQVFLNVIGGLITAFIIWWFAKPVVKKFLKEDALKVIRDKEVMTGVLVVAIFIVYALLVWAKLLPPPEFHDYMTVIDKEGYYCEMDACHPDKPLVRVGGKYTPMPDYFKIISDENGIRVEKAKEDTEKKEMLK